MEEQMSRPAPRVVKQGTKKRTGQILRWVTGLAWLVAALGVLIEVYYHEIYCLTCDGEATIGLIPLYLGFPIGAVGFVLILWRNIGRIPALLAAGGLAGILYFMGSYPDGAAGWIGAIFVGLAHLFLPLPGRFAAVLWTITGILGFPEFDQPEWGLINAFSVFGGAIAYSGAFVLLGFDLADRGEIPEHAAAGTE